MHLLSQQFPQQDCRESKKRLEEQVDELKKEVSSAEHQLQKNNVEIEVLETRSSQLLLNI